MAPSHITAISRLLATATNQISQSHMIITNVTCVASTVQCVKNYFHGYFQVKPYKLCELCGIDGHVCDLAVGVHIRTDMATVSSAPSLFLTSKLCKLSA